MVEVAPFYHKKLLFLAMSTDTTKYLSRIVSNVFLKTDVVLTLIDLLKTFIRFKIKELTAFTHSDGESISS